jgi:dynein regulatory complex protein 1
MRISLTNSVSVAYYTSCAVVTRTYFHQYLDAVVEQSSDKVSLVRVTADMAESLRAAELDAAHAERRKMLVDDVAATKSQLSEISGKWEGAIGQVGTEELRLALEAQQKACDALLDQKNELISKFRVTLKNKDEEFVKELRSQASDVTTMLEVMTEQGKATAKEYHEQLTAVEDTFQQERKELVAASMSEWKGR